MPTRMIREGLLDSERYASISNDGRLFFHHLMLLADDFGCVSLSPAFLRRRCFYDAPTNERISRLICELADADLIRTYDADRHALAFIPRFRQRLKRATLKYAIPPEQLYSDDDDALQKFSAIKREAQKSPAVGPEPYGNMAGTGRREVEVEGKRREVEVKLKAQSLVDKSVDNLTAKPIEKIQGKTHWEWAQELGIDLTGKGAADVKLEIEELLKAKINP